jgi:hypothetical protein
MKYVAYQYYGLIRIRELYCGSGSTTLLASAGKASRATLTTLPKDPFCSSDLGITQTKKI